MSLVPGKTTLSPDLILFKSEVTSIFTLSWATSLKNLSPSLYCPNYNQQLLHSLNL